MDEDDAQTMIQAVREGLLVLSEANDAIVEAVMGYRAKMAAAGFSETAAEHMAVDWHRVLLGNLMGGGS